jgi:hypothetical protein
MIANQLRIGNLVAYGVRPVPIKSIHTESVLKKEVHVYVELNENLIHYCIDVSEVKPIPLTEEWLLKFGFEKTMSWTYAKDLVGNLKLVYYLGEKGWSIGFKSYSDFPNLIHIHQLQNLYFALTGQELTYGGNK